MAVLRWMPVVLVAAGSVVAATPSLSATHHSGHQTTHKKATHHTTARKTTAHKGSSGKKSGSHKGGGHAAASAPRGTTAVPSGGLKVYCGPGKNPLLIRKMTQGRGTTVTVICH